MVIDYRDADRAIAAQKVLATAGIVAVYTIDLVLAFSEDPELTRLLVQRLQVPNGTAARATALLKGHDLWEEPLVVKWD